MSWRQYRALVVTFLRIAWRGPAATDGAKVRRGAFGGGFLGYVLIGAILMLPALFVEDPRLAGFLLQSMSFMMVALAFLNIYGDLVFDARDVPLLFWRPLEPRAYLAARVTAIVVYFAGVTTALNLPGAVALTLRFGPPWYVAAHLLGAFVGAFAALVVALLLLFLLLKGIGRERLRDTIAWVQIAVTFLFVGGNQLLARARFLERIPLAVLAGTAALFLPMSWAEAVSDLLSLRAEPGQPRVAAVGIAASAGFGALLVLVFGRSYGDILRALGEGDSRREAPRARGILRGWCERAIGSDPVARAGFVLAWATIRRARDYKVRAIPQFGLPVIFAVMAFLGRIPLTAAIVPALLASAACNGLICLVGSEYAAARWTWALAPVSDPAPALRGAAFAVLGALLAPVLVLLGAGALVAWGPLDALGFVSVSVGLALASLRCAQAIIEHFPCSLTLEAARRHSAGIEVIALFVGAMAISVGAAVMGNRFGAWVPPVVAAPLLVWGWRGLAARR